jgi:uncharacterized protein (DUF1697 family)
VSLRIALFRSIVIGAQRVKMADARAMAERVGGRDVGSVIATGNLVFRSRKAPRTLERELERECAAFYGRATEMVVKTADEWRALMAANPFATVAAKRPAHLLVWAMRSPIPDSGIAQLRARARGPERVERTGAGDFYIWFGSGDISASRIVSGFGLKALGAVGTNRNWSTCMKITALLDAMER